MLGSNSIPKNQRKNKNTNSTSQYSRTRKGRKINSNTYDVYDIEQQSSASKTKRKSTKNAKTNETINNIDIIEDIDKVPSRFDKNNDTNEANEKDILPPLSPVSIASESPESLIEISDYVPGPKVDTITIVIDKRNQAYLRTLSDSEEDDDEDGVEIVKEKYVKYSEQPTVFQTFTKNNVLWCHYCGTTHTSSWRHGPWGKKSLCNKHGCDYKGYGFTVRQPRLDLSKFAKETSKRIRPVIQEYCCVCFSNDSNKENALVMCNGCYRAYHQNCHPDKISSDIVHSSEPYYCKEECKHIRELKKIETELPRKNLPFMFNRGVTKRNARNGQTAKSTTKTLEEKREAGGETANALNSSSSSVMTTPSSSTPSSPSRTKVVMETLQEPEPKIFKSGLNSVLKDRYTRKRGKEEDKIVHYTKNLPPIIGFQHDEIPIPSWVYNPNLGEPHPTTSKRKLNEGEEEEEEDREEEEMMEDISDEAYIKRHHPLELSEKYSRCGSLINTSKIDEAAIHKMLEKQSKKRKLRKGYIYI